MTITNEDLFEWMDDPAPATARPTTEPLPFGFVVVEDAIARAKAHPEGCGQGSRYGVLVRIVDVNGRSSHHRIMPEDAPGCVLKELKEPDPRVVLAMGIGLVDPDIANQED